MTANNASSNNKNTESTNKTETSLLDDYHSSPSWSPSEGGSSYFSKAYSTSAKMLNLNTKQSSSGQKPAQHKTQQHLSQKQFGFQP